MRQRFEDLVGHIRLGNEIVGSSAEALHPVLHSDPRGHDDHRYSSRVARSFERSADVVAIGVRKHQVQENHIGNVFTELVNRAGAIERRFRLVAAKLYAKSR